MPRSGSDLTPRTAPGSSQRWSAGGQSGRALRAANGRGGAACCRPVRRLRLGLGAAAAAGGTREAPGPGARSPLAALTGPAAPAEGGEMQPPGAQQPPLYAPSSGDFTFVSSADAEGERGAAGRAALAVPRRGLFPGGRGRRGLPCPPSRRPRGWCRGWRRSGVAEVAAALGPLPRVRPAAVSASREHQRGRGGRAAPLPGFSESRSRGCPGDVT